MSVFNGGPFLAEAISSILGQTCTDFELLVVEDASTDRTPEILSSIDDRRLRVLKNPANRGLTASLNRGLTEARGEIIVRHDADDRSHPERLAMQVRFLDDHPDVAVVGSQVMLIDRTGRRMGLCRQPRSADSTRFALMFCTPVVHGAVAFRRALVKDKLGGYDDSFRTSQDAELWSRVATHGEIRNLGESLLDLRIHRDSVSSTLYSRENVLRIEPVLRRNILTCIGDSQLADEWPALWNAIVNEGVAPFSPHPERAVWAVNRIRDAFFASHPEGQGDRDISYIYAMAQLRIASFLCRDNRRAAIRALRYAVGAAPWDTIHALPRISARAVARSRRSSRLERSGRK